MVLERAWPLGLNTTISQMLMQKGALMVSSARTGRACAPAVELTEGVAPALRDSEGLTIVGVAEEEGGGGEGVSEELRETPAARLGCAVLLAEGASGSQLRVTAWVCTRSAVSVMVCRRLPAAEKSCSRAPAARSLQQSFLLKKKMVLRLKEAPRSTAHHTSPCAALDCRCTMSPVGEEAHVSRSMRPSTP